jgi:hypothetical protein
MNERNFNLSKLVIDTVREFGKVHPIRKELFRRENPRRESTRSFCQRDGEKLIAMQYYLANGEQTGYYGILSEEDCHCGCGAGHSNLAVLSGKDLNSLSEEELMDFTRKTGFYMCRTSDYPDNIIATVAKHVVFEMQTFRVGNRRGGSWPSKSTISGLGIPYDSCISLIYDLTTKS